MTQTTPNGKTTAIMILSVLLAFSAGVNFLCMRNGHNPFRVAPSGHAHIETGSIKLPKAPDFLTAVKATIASHVNDPDSVRWGEVTVVSPTVVCGSMNWRGVTGGYVGMSTFVWNEEGNVISVVKGVKLRVGPLVLSTDYPISYDRGQVTSASFEAFLELVNRSCDGMADKWKEAMRG